MPEATPALPALPGLLARQLRYQARLLLRTPRAVAGGAVTVRAGLVLRDLHLSAAALPALAATLVLGATTWASIGTAVSARIPTVDAAWPLLGLTYLPLVALSGSFGAVAAEPHWLATLIAYLPAEPAIDGASRSLRGLPAITAHDLAVQLLWGGAGLLFAVRCFRWEPRPPRRRRAARRTA